jgi:hypothetical protein
LDTDKNKALTIFHSVLPSSRDVLNMWATTGHVDNFGRISSGCIVKQELKTWTGITRTRPDRMHEGQGKNLRSRAEQILNNTALSVA